MIKFRLYYDKDKETEWLNRMAEEGWAMKSFFAGFYKFEECEKGKYVYQVDFGDKFGTVTEEYQEFMNDMGVEIVQTWGYWVILRKKAGEGAFELYTDVESSIEHYSKIRRMFKVATIIELVCFLIEIIVAIEGTRWAYAAACLIFAILLTCVNALVSVNNTIAQLEARKNQVTPDKKRRNVSALIPVGLLLNSCALLIDGSVSVFVHASVQLIAIAFMLVGVYVTMRSRSEITQK